MSLIAKRKLADEVAEAIQSKIASGEYAIGEKLPIESELMKLFGVGRSSIREAIKILSIQGLLDVQQGVGTFVATNQVHESLHKQMSKAEMADIIEVRSLLEVKIAEKAAISRTTKQLTVIQKFLNERKKCADKGDIEQCINADINFHTAIAEACGNQLLMEIYKTSSIEVKKLFNKKHVDTTAFINSHQLHEELYKSIQEQNAKNAGMIVKKIISRDY